MRSLSSDIIVTSASILSENTAGDVFNPDGMINDEGLTILRRKGADDEATTAIVDLGLHVVGPLRIKLEGSKAPQIGYLVCACSSRRRRKH